MFPFFKILFSRNKNIVLALRNIGTAWRHIASDNRDIVISKRYIASDDRQLNITFLGKFCLTNNELSYRTVQFVCPAFRVQSSASDLSYIRLTRTLDLMQEKLKHVPLLAPQNSLLEIFPEV